MKSAIVAVLCLMALGVCIEAEESRTKRFLFTGCKVDSECGANRCCVNMFRFCAPKRKLDQSCNLVSLHGCGCEDGLECRVYKSLGALKYYRCLEIEGSGM